MSFGAAGPMIDQQTTIRMIQSFLDRSQATETFREAAGEFLSSGMPNEKISFDYRSPPVKVERVLTKLLESERDLVIDGLSVDGRSGCEYFRGELTVRVADGETRRFRFHWDCRWRAEQKGWTDHFGFPDQIRAAHELGYDCFRVWEPVPADEDAAA